MTLHNDRSRQVHETLNGVNPSSSFRDMRSAKSGPNLWQIWQVFGPWASPYGANGHMTMTVHTYRPRQFHRTSNGENPSSGYRYGFRKFGSRPPARPPGPWRQYPSSPEGWGVKSCEWYTECNHVHNHNDNTGIMTFPKCNRTLIRIIKNNNCPSVDSSGVNTLRPRQNGRYFADDIFNCIFLNENAWISLKISLKFVPKVRIDNIPSLVQIMAWRRPGDKPLSEPMMVSLLTHICHSASMS